MKKRLLTLSLILGLHTSVATADITPIQLHATMGIVTNFILDDAIVYHGKSYKTVTSPYTGRVWLDRNLGANRVCTSLDDVQCYGDYYQWGRGYDGHQDENSTVTTTLATDINNAGSDFVIGSSDWTSVDSNGSIRVSNWLKTDGTSVCPAGFRVPTIEELHLELFDVSSANIQNNTDAYNSFLKLPAAGIRDISSGTLLNQGVAGFLWSSTAISMPSVLVAFLGGITTSFVSTTGIPIRCIDNQPPPPPGSVV